MAVLMADERPVATPEFLADLERRRPTRHIMFLGGPWHRQVKRMREPLPQKALVPGLLPEQRVEYDLTPVTPPGRIPWRAYLVRGYTPTVEDLIVSEP